MKKLFTLFMVLSIAGVSMATVTKPTMPATTLTSKEINQAGWYLLEFQKTEQENFVAGHFLTCFETPPSWGYGSFVPLLTLQELTAYNFGQSLVYITPKVTTANAGNQNTVLTSNGFYIAGGSTSELGSASRTESNVFMGWETSGSEAGKRNVFFRTGSNAGQLVPITAYNSSVFGYTSGGNLAFFHVAKIDPYEYGVTPWKVSIEGENASNMRNDLSLTYTGSGNVGHSKVYNNGTFFIDSDITPTSQMFTASTVVGKLAWIEIDSNENTISVTYYDPDLYFSTEVTGSTQNVNLGTFSYSVNGSSTSVKLKTTDATTPASYSISKNSAATLSLSRTYRGFKFNGFYLGEERLGLNPTLSASQLRTVTSDNPVVAKFTAQGDDVTLFYDDDPKSYRIPAIGTTSTGRLIAISDYRHNLDDIGRDNHGTGTLRIDLVYRTSDDNGQTWSAKKILKEGTDVRGNADCGFGDAAIACGDGKIAVFSASGSVMYSNTSASSHNCMARFVSTDNGETWEYSDITDKIIGTDGILPGTYGIFFGSGKLAVDKDFNGTGNTRIYGALLTKDGSSSSHNFVVYSDDLGETWKILGQRTDEVADADEPKVEILPNGQILLSSRRGGGRKFNIFTYGSGDTDKANGIGTWGTAANGCDNGGSNATNGEIFLTKAKTAAGTDTYLLLQSQPKGGTSQYDRRDVTVWYKEISSGETYTVDQIKTGWTQGKQISTQLSSYSTMSLQADGKLAFFFEEAPCYDDNYTKGYCMVYMPLTIESVTNGTYFSVDSDPSAQVTVNYTLSDEQGNTYTGTLSNCPIKDIATTLTTRFPIIITLGSDIEIVQVEDGVYSYKNTVSLPFKVSNADGEYWHNIYFPSNTQSYCPVYWSGSSGAATVQTCTEQWPYGASSFNTKANADKISWAIYSNGNTFSFTFRNKLADKYISVEGKTPVTSGTKNCDYSETGTAFTITPQGATTYTGDYKVGDGTGYLVAWSAGNGYTTYSTNFSHQGGWVKIVEAPEFDTEIATANEHLDKFRDMPGYYTPSDAVSAAKTAMADADNIKLNTLRSYQTLSSSIVLPVSGKFYRLKGSVSNKYAYSKGAGTQMGMSSTESDYQTAGLFYFNGNNTDGFSMLNYNDGYYVYNTHSIGVLGNSTKFVLAEPSSSHIGTLTLYQTTSISGNGRWMYDNGNNATPKVDRNSSYAANNCDWYIEEASGIPVTFKTAGLGYATFNSPVAVQIPENTKAYVCKIGTDGNTLTFYEITSVVDESGEKTIPANTPVLLYNSTVKDAGSDVTVSFPVTTIDTEITNNSFVGTLATEAFSTSDSEKDTYSLRTNTIEGVKKVGFYKKTSGTTLAGFKAWLQTAHQDQVRNFTIYFNGEDDATGIAEALGLDSDKVEVYDLNGRKLSGYQKGINIVNGKKIFK